jgi:hypothetical protein
VAALEDTEAKQLIPRDAEALEDRGHEIFCGVVEREFNFG